MLKLNFINQLELEMKLHRPLIQALIGPRQVGKTTGVKLLMEKLPKEKTSYFSADGELPLPPAWIYEVWSQAKTKHQSGILIIDEIQNVENWSAAIKKMWDNQSTSKNKLQVIILGSSSLGIQKGLSESLAGRFFLHRAYHWDYFESKNAFGLSPEKFLNFGGYPGSYLFIETPEKWKEYLINSLIDPVISKDILRMARVKSPALFRQCFEIICSYPAQEVSYNKLLGQIQDKGNIDLVKYYLELFEGAFLIKQLFKFSGKKILTRKSSPKILPLCPALATVHINDLNDPQIKGRIFELAVGASLIRLSGNCYYWRDSKYELDFVLEYQSKLFAIEVKSGRKKNAQGLTRFLERYPKAIPVIITPEIFFRKSLNEILLS